MPLRENSTSQHERAQHAVADVLKHQQQPHPVPHASLQPKHQKNRAMDRHSDTVDAVGLRRDCCHPTNNACNKKQLTDAIVGYQEGGANGSGSQLLVGSSVAAFIRPSIPRGAATLMPGRPSPESLPWKTYHLLAHTKTTVPVHESFAPNPFLQSAAPTHQTSTTVLPLESRALLLLPAAAAAATAAAAVE